MAATENNEKKVTGSGIVLSSSKQRKLRGSKETSPGRSCSRSRAASARRRRGVLCRRRAPAGGPSSPPATTPRGSSAAASSFGIPEHQPERAGRTYESELAREEKKNRALSGDRAGDGHTERERESLSRERERSIGYLRLRTFSF